MSIFGKLDAKSIPTNPFFIEKGEYSAEVTGAEFRKTSGGENQFFIEYTINDVTSQYNGSKAVQFFTLVDPEMSETDIANLPPEEQKNIRRSNSALKRTLCGNDSNSSQRGLGVDPDDLNSDTWDPTVLVGTKVTLGIGNYGPDNDKVTVRWVNIND